MNKPLKQKLCWNCEGSVARTLENCPYCGVYLNPEEEAPSQEPQAPYIPAEEEHQQKVPEAPYAPVLEKVMPAVVKGDEASFSFSSVVLPILYLTSGAIALLFSLILLIFSVDGKLTLQWDAGVWYYFALAALPLLLFGLRSLESKD